MADYVPLCEDHFDVVMPKVPKSACEICALRTRLEEVEKERNATHQKLDELDVPKEVRVEGGFAFTTAYARIQWLHDSLRSRVTALEEALVKGLLVLESLHAAVDWELSDELKASIAEAVYAGRAVLAPAAPQEQRIAELEADNARLREALAGKEPK